MSFGSPELLVDLLVLPFAIVGYLVVESRRAKRAASWSRPALLPNVAQQPGWRRHVAIALFLLALTALLVGFARPRLTENGMAAAAPTIVLTVDVSGSMAADDVQTTRIRAARRLAIEFLRTVPGADRVAVVTFGNKVQVVVAPTADRRAVIAGLPGAIAPRSGTSLGDGISAAVAVIAEAAGNSEAGPGHPGAVVVLSDGAQTDGGTAPLDAAATAFVQRVPVDTICIGTASGIVTQPLTVDGFRSSVQIPVPAKPVACRSILPRCLSSRPRRGG
jgi:Ca-activated chloride channel homolog